MGLVNRVAMDATSCICHDHEVAPEFRGSAIEESIRVSNVSGMLELARRS